MANDLHKLAIQIQGDIDERFGDAIKDMTGNLKQLEGGVKSIADSKIKPDGISKEFIKLNTEAGETSQKLNQLNLRMKQVDGYSAQRKATLDAAQRYRETQKEVRRLELAHKNSGTKEFAGALKAAQKASTEAERAYNKERKTLSGLDEKLKNAGIDTKDLQGEKKKLASEIENVTKKSAELGKSLQSLTKAKYHFQQLRGHAKQLGSDLMWVGKTWLKMAGGLAAGGFALFKITDSMAAVGDSAAKAAAKFNMNVEAIQELQYAAKLGGVDDFDGMIQKFNANVAKAAKGEGAAAKVLKELNLSAKQLYKMGPEKSIMVLADELNKIKDPARRARAELALYGKTGAEMGTFLRLGSKGIQQLRDEARATGLVVPKSVAAQAEAFNDARDRMMGTVSGLKNIVGGELLPIFTETFSEMSRFFIENQAIVRDFSKNLGEKMRAAIPELKNLATGAGKLAGGLWNVAKVVTKVVGGVDNLGFIIAALPLVKPIITIGRMGVALGGLVKSLWGVKGAIWAVGKALIMNPIGLTVMGIAGAAFLVYKYWEPIKGFFIGLWNTMSSGVDTVRESFTNTFASLPGWLQGTLSGVGNVILFPFKVGYQLVKATIGYFRGDFASVPDALRAAFKGITDLIVEPFNTAFTWVGEKWASLKGALGIGPKMDIPKDSFANRPVSQRARGGGSSIPILTKFAERGPEIAVPAGLADRSHGLASLDMAHRALGLGSLDLDEKRKNLSKQGAETSRKPEINLTAEISPQFAFYGADQNTDKIQQFVMDAMRECGARLLPEWLEQIRRVSYETP